jgi:hypothetical protein
MRNLLKINALALILFAGAQAFAVEDGLGTNHVRTLKAYDGIMLGDVKITNWTGVAASTLTNNSILTSMIQNEAVTSAKLAAAVAGDGLVGAAGSALAVNPGDGIQIVSDEVAVDASVVRTNGVQTIGGTNTFLGALNVPTPTAPAHATTKLYVDDLMSSSLATGSGAGETLRWDGAVWTNTAEFTVDALGNVAVSGALDVDGAVGLLDATQSTDETTGALVVDGGVGVAKNVNVGGALGVVGAATIESTTASTDKDTGALVVEGGVGVEGSVNAGGNVNAAGNVGVTGGLTVGGAVALGNDIATDTVAVTAKVSLAGAVVTVPSGTLSITAATGITATHIQRTYLKVRSDAGAIDLDGTKIAAGSPGQLLTLQGQDNALTIRLTNSGTLVLAGGIPFTLKNGHIIQLIYDGSAWREMFRTVPAP